MISCRKTEVYSPKKQNRPSRAAETKSPLLLKADTEQRLTNDFFNMA
jgi:hypothetical protein